jgi:hypothetical protein
MKIFRIFKANEEGQKAQVRTDVEIQTVKQAKRYIRRAVSDSKTNPDFAEQKTKDYNYEEEE